MNKPNELTEAQREFARQKVALMTNIGPISVDKKQKKALSNLLSTTFNVSKSMYLALSLSLITALSIGSISYGDKLQLDTKEIVESVKKQITETVSKEPTDSEKLITLQQELQIKTREEWSARPPKDPSDITIYPKPLGEVISTLTIHHSAMKTQPGPKGIQDLQMNKRGYNDIAYNFIISKGQIYMGRPLNVVGANAGESVEAKKLIKMIEQHPRLTKAEKQKERDSARQLDPDYGALSIVIDGHFSHGSIGTEDLKALKSLLNQLKKLYHIPGQNIISHKDVKDHLEAKGGTLASSTTVCPGAQGEKDIAKILPTLTPDTEKAQAKLIKPKEKHPNRLEEALEMVHTHDTGQIIDILGNYVARQESLKEGTHAEASTNLEQSKQLQAIQNIISGKSNMLMAPIAQSIEAKKYRGRVRFPNRVYSPKVINLKSSAAVFQARNRGDYPEIDTSHGLLVPLAHKLETSSQLLKTRKATLTTTVIGVNQNTGEILLGQLQEFHLLPNVLLSPVTRNDVRSIHTDANGKVEGKKSPNFGNARLGYYQPKITTHKGVKGSLPILFKPGQEHYVGGASGGGFIFESQDKKRKILVTGTANHIAQIFQMLKQEGEEYVTIYNIDNGTFNIGFHTEDKISPQELKRYDSMNTGGGNGLILQQVILHASNGKK